MPIIIDFQESQQYSDNPQGPDVNPTRFGRDAAALASLGGEVGDFGSKLMQARKQAEEVDAVANASASYRDWYHQRYQEMVIKNPTNFAEDLRKEADAKMQSHTDAMPTGDAQRMLNQRLREFNASAYGSTLSVQATAKVHDFKSNFGTRSDSASARLYNDPSVQMFRTEVDAELQNINASVGTINSEDEAVQLRQQAKHSMATGMLNGFSRDRAGAMNGLKAIEQNGSNGLNEALSSDEMRVWKERFDHLNKQHSENNVTALNIKHKNMVSNLLSGDPQKMQEALAGGQADALLTGYDTEAALPDPKITKPQVDEKKVELLQAKAHADMWGEMSKFSTADFEEGKRLVRDHYKTLISTYGMDPQAGASHENAYNDASDKFWASIAKERNDDIAMAVTRAYPGLPGMVNNGIPDEERVQAIMDKADHWGWPVKGLLTKPDKEAARLRLRQQAEDSPGAAASEMFRIASQKSGRQIVRELAEGGGIPQYLAAASLMASQDAATTFVTNMRGQNKQALDQSLKDMAPSTRNALEDKVTKQMDGVKTALVMSGPANVGIAETLREAVLYETVSGVDRRLDHDQAVTAAYNRIIGTNFFVSGNAMVPRTVGNTAVNKALVDAEMNRINNPETWPKWNVHFPERPEDQGHSQRKWVRLEGLIHDPRSGWVSNENMTGATFKMPDPDAPNKMISLTNELGLPIFIDYAKVSHSPSAEAKEGAKTYFDRASEVVGPAVKDTVDAVMHPVDTWNHYWNPPKMQKIEADAQATQPAASYSDVPYDPKDDLRVIRGLPKARDVFFGGKAEASYIQAGEVSGSGMMGPVKYADVIRKAELSAGMPQGMFLAQLTQESNLNPKAVSYAGAQGIAQFMPQTAAAMGLKKGDVFVPAKAVPKAAALMKQLHTKYGSWDAALAAYNTGEPNLDRAIKKYGSFKKALPHLPSETRNYVKKIIGG